MAHEHHDGSGEGFSAGVLVGLLRLILVVLLVLLFYFSPNVFNVNVNVRSMVDALTNASTFM